MKSCPNCHSTYPTDFTLCPRDGTRLVEIDVWSDGVVVREKYRILGKVGQGGMASVYKALHIHFQELRALKVISPELASDPAFTKRFFQEAVLTRRLQHPNAVRVEDVDKADDGRPFIVMEYIQGENIKELLQRRGPLPATRACAIVKQVAAALEAAHSLGIIHRDIKPSNIVLVGTPQGEQAKVLDFGIAKLKEDRVREVAGMTLTSTGVSLGTPAYMSPEQAKGKRGDELDARSDLYSLGVVMYHMLSGELPFKADTTMEMLMAHIQTPPPPIRSGHPEIPEAVAAVVMRCLEKKPERRPATATQLIEEIRVAELSDNRGPVPRPPRPQQRPTPAPALVIQSNPGGALVYIDDQPVGVTGPDGKLEFQRFASGQHRVALSLAGHRNYEEAVQISSGSTTKVSARLRPERASPLPVRGVSAMGLQQRRIAISVSAAMLFLAICVGSYWLWARLHPASRPAETAAVTVPETQAPRVVPESPEPTPVTEAPPRGVPKKGETEPATTPVAPPNPVQSQGSQAPQPKNVGPSAVPNLSAKVILSPVSLDFGEQSVNGRSAPKQVTLTNGEKKRLALYVELTGDYFLQGGYSPLEPGKSWQVSVSFGPQGPGKRDGTLTIRDNFGRTYEVKLTGIGIAGSAPPPPKPEPSVPGSEAGRGATPSGQPPPPPAAPACNLGAEPMVIEKGMSAVLSWNSVNASDVDLQPGLGKQHTSGSAAVAPTSSTTYTLSATGPGGNVTCTARVTVTAPPPPPPPLPPPRGPSEEDLFDQNMKTAYFDFRKWSIRPDAEQALSADADFLKQHPDVKFTIEGGAAETEGTEEQALGLAQRRADAVRRFLVNAGVAADNIATISYGKDRPVCTDSNEDCWQKNRNAKPAYGTESVPLK